MRNDFGGFLPYFTLPQRIETIEGRQYVETPEDLETLFASVRTFHRRLGINRIVRSCTQAEFKTDGSIEGVFKSLFFKDSTLVHRVPASFVLLQREGGQWRIGYNMYGISDSDAFGDALMHAPPLRQRNSTARHAVPMTP